MPVTREPGSIDPKPIRIECCVLVASVAWAIDKAEVDSVAKGAATPHAPRRDSWPSWHCYEAQRSCPYPTLMDYLTSVFGESAIAYRHLRSRSREIAEVSMV
jgi:hypothetical protein